MMRHGRFALLALWLIAVAAPAWGAPPLESVLPNGLRVILIPEPKAPVVTVQVWYRVGSRDEVSGKTGLSHLMEHMMFKGTERHGKGEFSRLIAGRGGTDNAFTSQDYTAYFETLAGDQVDLALELEADRMTGLSVSDDEFALERDVVKEERRQRTEDDPHGALTEHLSAVAYLAHPYRWPIIGWMDTSTAHRRRRPRVLSSALHAGQRTLVVVGDVEPTALMGRIKTLFGQVDGGPRPSRPAVIEPPQRGERRVTVKRDVQLSSVMVGYHVPNYSHPDSYALAVLAGLLAEGRSARLYRTLVYERQIALEAGGDYTALSADPPLLYVYGMAHPTTAVADLERAFLDEIERLKTAPPGERELTKAKNQIEAQFLLGQDSSFYRGMQVGMAETVGAGKAYLANFVANVRKVSAEDVVRVAKTYLIEDARTVGTLIRVPPRGGGSAP
jgi:zinc protease